MTPIQAREAAGLALDEAAALVGIGPNYLRRIERHGHAPYVLALRLSRHYRCRLDVFICGQPRRDGGEGRTCRPALAAPSPALRRSKRGGNTLT